MRDVAYHGQDESVLVKLGDLPELIVAKVAARDAAMAEISTGSRVWLNWNGLDARVLTS